MSIGSSIDDFNFSNLRNNQKTRVCHICKGRLSVKNVTYLLSNFDTTKHHLELDCVRCHTIYVLDDDVLTKIVTPEGTFYRPFYFNTYYY